MKGILLSGGTGSRLRPITHTGPKQLVPVANKPVLEYAVEDLKEAGITEIGVILGNKGRDDIQRLLGDGSEYGVEITYIVQGNPLGLAHAAGTAKEFVGDDDFVMYLGDNIFNEGITEMVESFRAGEYDAGIALQRVANPDQFGIADVADDETVLRLIEKPDDPPSNLALIGIYMFSPVVFDAIERLEPSWRGELEITDAIQFLLESERDVDSHLVDGWWKDTGKPKDILEANRLVLEDVQPTTDGRIDEEADVTGMISLAENARIEAGAVVRGPVSIASDTVIEANTYIGPYTSIGPNTRVANAHIENSVVIGECEISTNRKIVDSLIGSGTSIGNADERLPMGRQLIVGENSELNI